jgi:SpoVK/Ycf46/Vps4 family AAA+-type ATPase
VINTGDNKGPGPSLSFDNNDKFNAGILLSKIDGSEDQDGRIIIAAANDIDKFDPALYRNGRFKLIKLDYIGRKQISLMIEKYCEIKLTQLQVDTIRDDRIIQTLNIKQLIAKHLQNKNYLINSSDIDEIIKDINTLEPN